MKKLYSISIACVSHRGLFFLILLFSLFFYYKEKDFENTLLHGNTSFLIFEFVTCSLLYVFLKCFQKNNIRAKVFSLGIIFSYYIAYEFLFRQFGSVLKLQDFLLFSEFVEVIPFKDIFTLFVITLTPVVLYFSNLSFLSNYPKIIIPFVLTSLFFLTFNLPLNIKKSVYESIPQKSFSAEHVVAFYGVITAAIIFEFERQFFRDNILQEESSFVKGLSSSINLPKEQFLDKKNIHMIVYESYIDVRRLKSVKVPDILINEINNSYLSSPSTSIAPGFGNGTARSEFEILCGVPSLQLLGAIEFNLFEGEEKIDCLPSFLSQHGFKTIASHPFKPNYYNRIKAYQTLSFNEIRFGEKYSKVLGGIKIDDAPAGWLFDKSLFHQNLSLVKENLKQGNIIFNYVLTAYGHYPFERSEKLRPSVINVEEVDTEVNRLFNQTYYRIKELDKYIRSLREIDPTSLIVIVGDHLPPLTGGESTYKKLGLSSNLKHDDGVELFDRSKFYESFAIMLDGSNENELPNIKHFNLKNIIMDNLYRKEFCKKNNCKTTRKTEDYKNEYMKLIYRALKSD